MAALNAAFDFAPVMPDPKPNDPAPAEEISTWRGGARCSRSQEWELLDLRRCSALFTNCLRRRKESHRANAAPPHRTCLRRKGGQMARSWVGEEMIPAEIE